MCEGWSWSRTSHEADPIHLHQKGLAEGKIHFLYTQLSCVACAVFLCVVRVLMRLMWWIVCEGKAEAGSRTRMLAHGCVYRCTLSHYLRNLWRWEPERTIETLRTFLMSAQWRLKTKVTQIHRALEPCYCQTGKQHLCFLVFWRFFDCRGSSSLFKKNTLKLYIHT